MAEAIETTTTEMDTNVSQDCGEGNTMGSHGEGDVVLPMDEFLQRTKSERMYELRRIQHGDRPVTSQGKRESIDNFFSKRIEAKHLVESSPKANIPANVDSVEEHRPEAVVIEIQGVSEQGRVSNVLQTAAFRRQLENIIRGSISTVTRRNSTPPPSASSSSQHSLPQTSSPILRPFPPQVNRPSPPPSESARSRSDSIDSSRTSLTSASSAEAETTVTTESELQNVMRLQDVQNLHRDDFVEEISDLIHQRIVSTTLEGDFRRSLEIHVQNHLDMTETDGRRVQEFIQSIPQSRGHVRNDFSDLGIQVGHLGENWDNISVTSISAAAVPYTQTNLHMSREINRLKTQMEELKSMVRLSFDLQLDIQRSIHQEVSAALNHTNNAGETTAAEACPTLSRPSRPINDTHCLICLDNFSDSVLYQCGHMCVCYPCGRHLISRNAKCPVCRAPIKDIIRAYRCNQD
ncbi:hypothetical protein ScPMuIL_001621 [Solemya velum]